MALYLPIYDNILIDQGMDDEDTESTASEDTQEKTPNIKTRVAPK